MKEINGQVFMDAVKTPEQNKAKGPAHASPSFPDNLVTMIGDIELPLTEGQIEGLRWAVSTLLDREQLCITMRFEQGQTYREIGSAIGVTPGRALQIINKAIRKLRHPSRLRIIQEGMEGINKSPPKIKVVENDYSVVLMNLSTRNSNILTRAKIETIGDVCNLIENDPGRFRNLRNFGKGYLKELLEALVRHGVEFDCDAIDTIIEDLWHGQKVIIRHTGWK